MVRTLQIKVPVIISTMIKSVHEEACLGIPPEPFTTNASETIKFSNQVTHGLQKQPI